MKFIVARYASGFVRLGDPCPRCGGEARLIYFVAGRSRTPRGPIEPLYRPEVRHAGCDGLLGWGPHLADRRHHGQLITIEYVPGPTHLDGKPIRQAGVERGAMLTEIPPPGPVCPECVAGRPPHPETQREPDLRKDVIAAAELLRRFEGKPWCTRHRCELVAMSVDDFTAATVERFRAYHQEHPSWGVLHVALDDGNLDDDSVGSCITFAEEQRDVEGLSLALILRAMNAGQREYLEGALNEPVKH